MTKKATPKRTTPKSKMAHNFRDRMITAIRRRESVSSERRQFEGFVPESVSAAQYRAGLALYRYYGFADDRRRLLKQLFNAA